LTVTAPPRKGPQCNTDDRGKSEERHGKTSLHRSHPYVTNRTADDIDGRRRSSTAKKRHTIIVAICEATPCGTRKMRKMKYAMKYAKQYPGILPVVSVNGTVRRGIMADPMFHEQVAQYNFGKPFGV